MCMKFVSPGIRGVPDRVLLLPHGFTVFVEVKKPGGAPRPDQTLVHRRMALSCATVLVVDSYEAVDLLMMWVKKWINAWEEDANLPAAPDCLQWWTWDRGDIGVY